MLEVTPLENRDGFQFHLNGDRVWCVVEIYGYHLQYPPPPTEMDGIHIEFDHEFSIGVYQAE